ncbi:MAG TPA: hypothetical protein DEO59_05760, partial [Balneola sp.]|nr:hypothetical protein [Balneola sp.]
MTIRMNTLEKTLLTFKMTVNRTLLLLLFLCVSSAVSIAQPTSVASQSGELQIASLEQAYDSQVILILSNHFDRKKFFVDVNINAEFVEETFQTPGTQPVTRRQQSFLPGLPFLP